MNSFDDALTRVVTRYPFFAPGILHLQVIEDTSIPVASTNGKHLKINPVTMPQFTTRQQVMIALHEWCHVMLFHITRRNGRRYDLWLRASDYEANDLLHGILGEQGQNCPFDWIDNCLYDPRFHEMTADQIYTILEREDRQNPNQQPEPNPLGDDVEQAPAPAGPGEQSQQGQPQLGPSQPGSQPDLTPEQIEEIENDIKQKITAGLHAAKMRGMHSADIERKLGALVEPTIDWKSALAEFIQTRAKDDYSFRRPNVRMLGTGFVIPSLYSERIDCLVFAGDTSGSISGKEMEEYTADLINAFESVPIDRLILIWCDANVRRVQEFRAGDSVEPRPSGGGGTDFRPPFRYVEQEHIDPAALIYLTDGWCNSFAPDPGYPVLWCVYGGNKGFQPPYGEVLQVYFKGGRR